MSALLALSDVLVIRALERACSRGLSGDVRRVAWQRPDRPHYRAYESFRIPEIRRTYALDGAWASCPELAHRWQLPIDAAAWSTVLQEYCTRLLTNQTPHSLDDLDRSLCLLGAGHAV